MTCLKYSKASFSPSSYSEKTCREKADASRPQKILRFSLTFNVCLHLMYFEAAWVLVSPEAQVFPQIILNPPIHTRRPESRKMITMHWNIRFTSHCGLRENTLAERKSTVILTLHTTGVTKSRAKF